MKNMKALIMAGGKGTRLLPLTANKPKPMVQLIDKPALVYTIELLKKHNITEIGMTVGYLADKIVEYFKTGSDFGVKITYFFEDEPLGTAGGVKNASDFVSDTFVVLSGDAYTEVDLSKAVSFHQAKSSPFTVVCQPKQNTEGLGLLEIDFENKISSFVEKPLSSSAGLVNTGIYIVQKDILSMIPKGFYDFGRNLLPRIFHSCYAFVDYSYWSDIGTLKSYYDTNLHLVEKLEEKKWS